MNRTAWSPSPYGTDDQIGMLNEITPATVVEAMQVVREGRVYDLSHTLDAHVPAFPGRSFRQHLGTNAHQLNRRRADAGSEGWGENNVNWIVDVVYGTSQLGTHLDALNHLQVGACCYNGYTLGGIAEEWGTNKLGIETAPQVVTRGVLVNVAAGRGVVRLQQGDVITVDEVEAYLERSGLALRRSDALLFHTGWGDAWTTDPEQYLAGEPGPGMALAAWLVRQGVVLTGCDTWSFGPVPPEDPRRPFEVPQTLNVKHGLFIVENLKTADLAQAGDLAVEFLFVLTHANVRGATGAWVAPIAIR